MKTIPKTLHIIWIGDQTQRPDNCIATWLHHHPGWTLKIWGNDDLSTRTWRCERQMLALAPVDLRAVVDLMRWEILADEGGVAVAADSLCLRTLPDELLAREMFACWENEIEAPGMLAADYIGCHPGNAFLNTLVDEIAADMDLVLQPASQAPVPYRLTRAFRTHRPADLSILPSHSFMPRHHRGARYGGPVDEFGVPAGVFACELWASTLGYARSLHQFDVLEMLDVFTHGGSRRASLPLLPVNEDTLHSVPLPRLFPHLDWKRPQQARVQAFALAAQELVAAGSWLTAAEYARATYHCSVQMIEPQPLVRPLSDEQLRERQAARTSAAEGSASRELAAAVPSQNSAPEEFEATSPFVRELWSRLKRGGAHLVFELPTTRVAPR